MFKRTETLIMDDDTRVSAKRAKLDIPKSNFHYDKRHQKEIPKDKNTLCDDLWGDDFAEEDIEEMDFVASQACLQDGNVLDNTKLRSNNLYSMKSDSKPEKSIGTTIICDKTSQLNLPLPMEKSNYWLKRNIQGTSRGTQDIIEINYSQFKNKLITGKNHNSTFQGGNNFFVHDDKELEKLQNDNRKLLNDFITKDGETVFLRQQLQQVQLRAENEKLQKMRLIEEQANRHRSEINKICKEKEHLKTQIELQNLEIGNLLERCKLLESGNIKLKEPQSLYMNTSFNRSKCSTSINCPTNNTVRDPKKVKEVYVQTNTYQKNDYRLKTCNTYSSLTRISELMFQASVVEKPIVNIKVIEKTGRRNLSILQEEETFRIFENPDLVKPIVTIVDGKKLTTEFVLLEIAAIQRKLNSEIESKNSIPIINKLILTARELMLNVIIVLQTIFYAMRNDDIRDMNDLYFSTIYKDHKMCVKSECEADAWHEGEHGIEARRLLAALSHISLESSYLSSYLAGKSSLRTHNDECYNRYLRQMIRYNAWPKKDHKFEMLEIILECVSLIERVRRSHQFTGLISAIVKILCNVQEKIGYCTEGLEYVCLIFKKLVFSRPLSLCYTSLTNFLMIFSTYSTFASQLCRESQSIAIKNWKGVLHFTPDACVLQILMAQIEHFQPDFLTMVNMTHALISSVRYILQTDNNLLKTESSRLCNCYKKLLQFTINMLRKCSETRLIIIDNIKRQDPSPDKCYTLKKINYKDYAQTKSSVQNVEKQPLEMYPKKLDRNFWFGIKKIQHKVLREGIKLLCHLAICDPDFIIRSTDIEDSFHLFVRNITFFNDLKLHENEREALDRIKTTFIVDRGVQNETETQHKTTCINQLNMNNFKKKVIPTIKNRTGSTENSHRIHMAIRTLYNAKTEYMDN